MRTPTSRIAVLAICSIIFAFACKRDKEIIEYERVKAKAWDTTLASTLGRSDGAAIDPIYLDTNLDEKLNVQGGKNVCFDINGDGIADLVHEWNTLDAQVVYDANRNGQIDDGREIMNETGVDGAQNKYRNGWEKARDLFDTNRDGIIDGAELDKVSVWTDANGNGKVDAGELKSAKAFIVLSIDTQKGEFVMRRRI